MISYNKIQDNDQVYIHANSKQTKIPNLNGKGFLILIKRNITKDKIILKRTIHQIDYNKY